jgi:hypothetical protein
MFSLTLAVAFVEPFIGGVLWDLFHLCFLQVKNVPNYNRKVRHFPD